MALNKTPVAEQSPNSQLGIIDQAKHVAAIFPAYRYEKLDLQPVEFPPDAQDKQSILYHLGSVVSTRLNHVVLIPKRSRDILDAMNIPYTVVSKT